MTPQQVAQIIFDQIEATETYVNGPLNSVTIDGVAIDLVKIGETILNAIADQP